MNLVKIIKEKTKQKIKTKGTFQGYKMTQPMNQNQKELQCECHILRKCQTYKCWFVYCLAKAQNIKKNSSKKKKKKKRFVVSE
jgi:hypothetical protein